jgi:hypothetical protein
MPATGERFDVEAERKRLGAMNAGELRQRCREISGDEARSRNREDLIWRIRATPLRRGRQAGKREPHAAA